MMKKTIWIVIASSTNAEIYLVDGRDYSHIDSLSHPESLLKSGDLVTDRPGRFNNDNSEGGQYEPKMDAHKEQQFNFAREIAHYLEKHRQDNSYESLVLCAEPHFHGFLNQTINKQTKNLIIKAIEKDYIPLPKAKMQAVLKNIIEEL